MGPGVIASARSIREMLADDPELAESAVSSMERGDVLFTADPPLHTRHRMFVAMAFTKRSVEDMRPGIRKICEQLVDGFIDDGRVDLVAQYSRLLPVYTIGAILGVPAKSGTRTSLGGQICCRPLWVGNSRHWGRGFR